jgi:hypothetical protein
MRRQQAQRAGQHRGLVGEDVAEHVLGDDHVEGARLGDQVHGHGIHQLVFQRARRGIRSRTTRVATSRHSREVSSTLALSTEVSLPLRRRASRAAMRDTRSISTTL